MGVIHFLARSTPDRALFELGKFWWEPAVFFGEAIGQKPSYQLALAPHDLLGEIPLYASLLAALEHDGGMPADQRNAYAAELARRITRFAGGHPVEFLNDCSSDLDDYRTYDGDEIGELIVADTAYSDDWKEST